MSYYLNSDLKTKEFIKKYLGTENTYDICFSAVRALYASCSDNVVISMQDVLSLGNEGRMNTPSKLGGNWQWRSKGSCFNDSLASRIKELAQLYGRDGE